MFLRRFKPRADCDICLLGAFKTRYEVSPSEYQFITFFALYVLYVEENLGLFVLLTCSSSFLLCSIPTISTTPQIAAHSMLSLVTVAAYCPIFKSSPRCLLNLFRGHGAQLLLGKEVINRTQFSSFVRTNVVGKLHIWPDSILYPTTDDTHTASSRCSPFPLALRTP